MRVVVLSEGEDAAAEAGAALPGAAVLSCTAASDCLGRVWAGAADVLVVVPPADWPAAAVVARGACDAGIPVVLLPPDGVGGGVGPALARLRAWLAEPDWAERGAAGRPEQPSGGEASMAGTLVIIGGHEDREGEKVVLSEVVRKAGKRRVVVVTAASEEPDEMFAVYQKAFTDLGVKDVVMLDARTREDALDGKAAEPLAHAGCVFFTGGDQLRLTSQLGDTPVFQAVQKLYDAGGVVAGTSAGASVLSDTMLVSGESGAEPKAGDAIRMAPGFGFVEGVVIDQHFAERGRTGRLLAAVAQNPKSLGIGIGEDTAIVVERSRFRVVGSGGVYVFDGAGVTFSTVADAGEDEPLTIHDVTVHALAPGDRFDLKPRRPFRPADGEE